MRKRTAEREASQWLTFSTTASDNWAKILEPLRGLVKDGLDGLFVFELESMAAHSPALLLRAAVRMAPHTLMVPLRDSDLVNLKALPEDPVSVDLDRCPKDLTFLVSFIEEHECASALVADLRVGDTLWGCLVACSKQPASFSPDELSRFSVAASHIALNLENKRLRAETTLRLSEALSLQNVSAALVEKRNLDRVLSMIIDEAIRLLDASDAVILLLGDEDEEWFEVRASAGPDVTGLRSGRMVIDTSLNGLVARTGQPILSNNVMTDSRANRSRAERLNVHTAVIAPLNIHDETIGTIAVHNKHDGQFSRTDLEVLCAFANHVAIAIDNARLFKKLLCAKDEVQQKARELQELLVQVMNIQEKERQRIASAIHDRVISRIVGASYEVEACLRLHQRSESLTERLNVLNQILKEAAEKTRTSIYNLWPATLEHMGLPSALQELFSRQEKRTGITHTLRMTGTCHGLSSAAKIATYRIAQEALNNVRQHADATSVNAWVRFTPDKMRMILEDDGGGFDVEKIMREPPRRHFGLVSMRERALGIGGNLTVKSKTGTGCRIVLDIPMDKACSSGERDQPWQ